MVLESTTYPGTTDEDLRKVLEEGSGLKAGTDFHLAFSPEREDPGNAESVVAKIPKVVYDSMGRAMKGRRIPLVGLAYTANVDDDRESPGYVLMDKMSKLGVSVSYFAPYIPVIRPSLAHAHWAGVQSVAWFEEVIGSLNAALISTAHANVDYAELGQWANLIVDTRNAMKGIASRSKNC